MKKAYSAEERFEALKLAKEIGNQAAADRLGIKVDTLYAWISKAKKGKSGFSEDPGNIPIADTTRLKELEKELREAREEIEILQDALGFFVKRRKK
ncbi:MAG: transposase [Bacteroidota bacterium]